MPKRLLSRTSSTPKKVKEAPEPETYMEKGSVNVAEKPTSLLGKCNKCDTNPSNSEVDHLCLTCHKLANGFEFNADKNSYVKRRK